MNAAIVLVLAALGFTAAQLRTLSVEAPTFAKTKSSATISGHIPDRTLFDRCADLHRKIRNVKDRQSSNTGRCNRPWVLKSQKANPNPLCRQKLNSAALTQQDAPEL